MSNQWKIQLFAGLAERFGKPEIILNLEENILQVKVLKQTLIAQYPDHEPLITASFVAANQSYAADDDLVTYSDELALLPPVSGGEPEAVERFAIRAEPLSVETITAKVIVPGNGATLTFTGTTREWTQGQRTVRLEYEAYVPMALKMLRQIGAEISQKWKGAVCAIEHRTGVVGIAEISVVIAVSTPHRDTCYEASRYAIERLKEIVPIWKREIWEDGSEWKGHQQGPWNPAAPPN
ncbi:molybdenum cofactor biosynthesis protein [Paenibacillus nasutitermitis]|uniref:Molybdopterin synthase catalytic subunit n=1 Tax=Paenibacillus nasutitermitis TaxID=1652958 RepID=A0A917DWX6_9BACL|nr:molybdenum cofactor biosynthesis protein MoaE [Paenibacillus nasutitermitis]GGD74369.1 hypothetical protein GCM10010911_35320 [Paenibacillus nasutitermitis]